MINLPVNLLDVGSMSNQTDVSNYNHEWLIPTIRINLYTSDVGYSLPRS